MAKNKSVENPVLIAVKIERETGKDRKLTSYEPKVIVAASEAQQVCKDLNSKVVNKPDSKTKRTFIVCPTTGDSNEVVPVIVDAADYALQNERALKRTALKNMGEEVRNGLHLPAPDAEDAAIDAWTPGAPAARPAAK